MLRSGVGTFVLDSSVLLLVAGGDVSPGDIGGLCKGRGEARRTLGWITLIDLHTLKERESAVVSIAGADGADVAGEFVLDAHFINIGDALVSTMLAGEGTISILLGVTLNDILKIIKSLEEMERI